MKLTVYGTKGIPYWPQIDGEDMSFEDMTVHVNEAGMHVTVRERMSFGMIKTRTFKVSGPSAIRLDIEETTDL